MNWEAEKWKDEKLISVNACIKYHRGNRIVRRVPDASINGGQIGPIQRRRDAFHFGQNRRLAFLALLIASSVDYRVSVLKYVNLKYEYICKILYWYVSNY